MNTSSTSTRHSWTPTLALALSVAVGLVAACDDDVVAPLSRRTSPLCTRDQAMLEAHPDCQITTDCPCGASCVLLRCEYDCIDDADCGEGEGCNDFGECVPMEHAVEVPVDVPMDPAPTFDVLPTSLQLLSADDERTVWITSSGENHEPLRVVGRDGVEVSCSPGEGFADECTLDGFPDGDSPRRQIVVRGVGPQPDEDQSAEVLIANGPYSQRIGIVRSAPEVPLLVRPAGVYRGHVRPRAAGFSSRTTVDPLPVELSRISVPVEVWVFPDDGAGRNTIVFSDQVQGLFPEAETVGRLFVNPSSDREIEIPSRSFISPCHVGGASSGGAGLVCEPDTSGAEPAIPVDVVIAVGSSEVRWNGVSLNADLRTEFLGATLDEHAPFITWELTSVYVGDLPDDAVEPSLPAAVLPQQPAGDQSRVDFAVELSAHDRLPPSVGTPLENARAALCSPDRDTPFDLGAEMLALDGVASPTGDLECCALDDVSCDFPAAQMSFTLIGDSVVDSVAALGSCLSDLGEADAPSAGCVDVGRVLATLGFAQTADRDRATLGVGAPEEADSAVAHRLLQQWLSLHAYMAAESQQVITLSQILAGDSSNPSDRFDAGFSLEDMLEASIGGWDLLLSPRVAVPLAIMPPQVLSEPDYRPRLFEGGSYVDPGPVFTQVQTIGLPVTALATMRRQIDVLSEYVLRARFRRGSTDDVRYAIQAFLRRAWVILAIAQGLYDQARSEGALEWEADWRNERARYGGVVTRLLNSLEALDDESNPLGIEEEDLPLYRVGDQDGTFDRFSAISDYLLGSPGAGGGIAAMHVDDAIEEYTAVRESWIARLERDWWQSREASDQERRAVAINRHYGEIICGLQGQPACDSLRILTELRTVLESGTTLDEYLRTAYLNHDEPACVLERDELNEVLTTADVGYALCVPAMLRRQMDVRSSDPQRIAVYQMFDQLFPDSWATGAGTGRAVGSTPYPFTFERLGDEGVITFTLDDGTTLAAVYPRDIDDLWPANRPDQITRAEVVCESARQATLALRPADAPNSCTMADECPLGMICTAGACLPDPADAAERAECYYGSMGAAALAIRAAAREIDVARSELDENIERYDISTRSCIIAQSYHDQMESELDSHNDTMTTLGTIKLAADVVANVAEGVRNGTDVVCAALSGGSTVAASAVEATAKSVSDGMEFGMAEAERQHGARMAEFEHASEDEVCFNNAEMELVGVRTAALRIEQAHLNLAQQSLAMTNLQISLGAAISEGLASLDGEAGRATSPVATNYWLDEGVERFRRFQARAQRSTYLAVRAVEYEQQMSLSDLRGNVLTALGPYELEQVIDDLRSIAATGSVDGRNPNQGLAVVSLRENLLQVDDRSEFPDGFQTLTDVDRFRMILTSPANSVYDEDGTYLGQEIQFSLHPLGTSGLGDPAGIPILAGTTCAERLWSVNASLLGEDLYQGSDTTFTTILLRKRNTFFSQWCNEGAHEEPFQIAATRPWRNLFRDPFTNYEGEGAPPRPQSLDTSGDQQGEAFTNASISAYFQITRAELEDESYFNGDSQELAGRGLFGSYALFFPASVLADGDATGLVLGQVEDVLLRIDYVAVTR